MVAWGGKSSTCVTFSKRNDLFSPKAKAHLTLPPPHPLPLRALSTPPPPGGVHCLRTARVVYDENLAVFPYLFMIRVFGRKQSQTHKLPVSGSRFCSLFFILFCSHGVSCTSRSSGPRNRLRAGSRSVTQFDFLVITRDGIFHYAYVHY